MAYYSVYEKITLKNGISILKNHEIEYHDDILQNPKLKPFNAA